MLTLLRGAPDRAGIAWPTGPAPERPFVMGDRAQEACVEAGGCPVPDVRLRGHGGPEVFAEWVGTGIGLLKDEDEA